MANSVSERAGARLITDPLAQGDIDMTTIDLNCDLGEGFGAWEMGNDAAMIELATSVNIACGFHAGDADIMRRTVELAKSRGVSIGSHTVFRDFNVYDRRPIYVQHTTTHDIL